jgi:UDP-2,4-diacetamido-2,4,6-trideoxy-beta-L-altropyranose hydrolase
MKDIKILFRLSGGKAPKKQLGFGHAYRSIHLAKYFKKNSLFFLLEDYGGLKKLFFENDYSEIFHLNKNISITEDIQKTQKIIENKKIDILIIDKFHPSIHYIKTLRKIVKVVVISDLYAVDFPSDLVFNGFIGLKNQTLKNKFGAKCFLGPSYQILNRNFSKKKKNKKKYQLLVTFGGLDENRIMSKFLQSLNRYDPELSIKIILGPGALNQKISDNILKSKISIIQETDNMFKEISSSEFGLCSGGITSYEFACLKVPFAIIPQVRHQIKTAKEWEKSGIAINLGMKSKFTEKKIQNLLKLIKSDSIFLKKSNVVDGLGGRRISKEIMKLK